MKKEDFLRELEEIFLLNSGTIKETDTLKSLDVDSTGMLNLIAFLSSELEMNVDTDALRKAESIRDLIDLTDGRVQ